MCSVESESNADHLLCRTSSVLRLTRFSWLSRRMCFPQDIFSLSVYINTVLYWSQLYFTTWQTYSSAQRWQCTVASTDNGSLGLVGAICLIVSWYIYTWEQGTRVADGVHVCKVGMTESQAPRFLCVQWVQLRQEPVYGGWRPGGNTHMLGVGSSSGYSASGTSSHTGMLVCGSQWSCAPETDQRMISGNTLII